MAIKQTVRYEPDNFLKEGYINGFSAIVSEIKDNHWLTGQLFRRDFLATYKQSFLGIFWVFLIPLVTMGTFLLLNQSGILAVGDMAVPYPVFAVIGVVLWQLFSSGLMAGTNSLVKAGSMLTKINFSKKSL